MRMYEIVTCSLDLVFRFNTYSALLFPFSLSPERDF